MTLYAIRFRILPGHLFAGATESDVELWVDYVTMMFLEGLPDFDVYVLPSADGVIEFDTDTEHERATCIDLLASLWADFMGYQASIANDPPEEPEPVAPVPAPRSRLTKEQRSDAARRGARKRWARARAMAGQSRE